MQMKIRNIKPYLPSLIGLELSITALIYVDEIDIFMREVVNFKRRGGSVITDIGVLLFYFLAKTYYVYRSSQKSGSRIGSNPFSGAAFSFKNRRGRGSRRRSR